eukprot:TRINITY_DN57776_c0_g1_i1.p1 TRINITY_DN57776_c0_g1~~TRINITY_DN57776_c0_g1_i1.p1  ORF type:complete len:1025 (+),score=140.04 TRINITY_DN57776_c0_g1_i1:90-3164(+)
MRPAPRRGRLSPSAGQRGLLRPSAQAAARVGDRAGAPLAISGALADYVKVRTVGRGSFGEALLVKHRCTGHIAVLKRVRLEVTRSSHDAANAAESAAREAQVLQKFRHPHIVEFLGAFVDSPRDVSGSTLCLLMAYCEGGDLQQRLQRVRQEGRRLHEQPCLRWFDQLCSALAYVHQQQVLHRDLKPSNIFLSGRQSSGHPANHVGEEEQVSIGDFGVSKPLTHAMELATTMVGTPCYLSPEVCRGKPYSYKSDIWSLGCVLFEMMALRPPFGSAPNLEALVNRIIRADINLPDNLATQYPEASRCARAMLRQQIDRRPTAQALLNRPRLNPPANDLPGLTPPSNGAGPLPSTPASAPCLQPAQTPPLVSSSQPSFEPPARIPTSVNQPNSEPPSQNNGAPVASAPQVQVHIQPGQLKAPRVVAAQVAAAAAAASAAVTAAHALSPRARGRQQLASKILEAEAEHQIALSALQDCDPSKQGVGRHLSSSSAAAAAGLPGPVVRRRATLGPNGQLPSSGSQSPPVVVVVTAAGSPGAPPPASGPTRLYSAPWLNNCHASSGSGAAVRASSGEPRIYSASPPAPAAMPMTARTKGYQPQAAAMPAQRSPRLSCGGFTGNDSAGAGGSSPSSSGYRSVGGVAATPRSPRLAGAQQKERAFSPKNSDLSDAEQDPRRKQRREERCRSSQAFRDWLREQKGQKGGKSSLGIDDDESPKLPTEESSLGDLPADEPTKQTADKPCVASEDKKPLRVSRQTSGEPPRQSRQSSGEWKTAEIYCPGFPVMTVNQEPARHTGHSGSPRTPALIQVAVAKTVDVPKLALPRRMTCEANQHSPRGPADVGGTPSDTAAQTSRPIQSQSAINHIDRLSRSCTSVCSTSYGAASARSKSSDICRSFEELSASFEASLPGTSGLVRATEATHRGDVKGISPLDDSKRSVSIGDRIEGIRASLEARMGTQRFQKLYKSLADDNAVNSTTAINAWPRDSSMVLPEDIDEAFLGAGDGGCDDVNSLVPLVTKLVACEQSYFS